MSLGNTRGVPVTAEPAATQLQDSELWKLGKKGKVFIPSILKKKALYAAIPSRVAGFFVSRESYFQINCDMQTYCLYMIVIYGNGNTDGKKFFWTI